MDCQPASASVSSGSNAATNADTPMYVVLDGLIHDVEETRTWSG